MVTIMDETRLGIHPSICIQEMGPHEKAVVLSLETGDLYTCNETTCDFLRLIEQTTPTFRAIVDALLDRYEVGRAELTADLREVAQRALDEKLVVLVE